MADNDTATPAQVVETLQPQAGEPQTQPATQAVDKPALDAEALRKELEDARKEAAKYRNDRKAANDTLSKLQQELEALRQAQMTEEQKKQAEYEKAQREAAELRTKLEAVERANQELALRSIVQATAAKLGIVDPDAAFVLLKNTKTIEPGPDGWDDKAIDKAVRDLVKDKPYLLGAPTASAANPARQDANATSETNEARRQRLYGGGVDIFSPEFARNKGGGVRWPEDR